MKKIILLFYCQICVNILGFPMYLKHTKTEFIVKKQAIIDKYNFNCKTEILYQNQLIKQH
jgi:hypothetical protein